MQKAPINIGDKIELEHVKSLRSHKISDSNYGSQLLDFDGIRKAKIAMPIYESRVIPLEVGDEYKLCFYTNMGLFQCIAQITKRYLERTVYIAEIEIVTELKKFQRRDYYRLDCLFPIKHRNLSKAEKVLLKRLQENNFQSQEEFSQCEEELDKIEKEWFDASISDLSGGGIRFHSNMKWRQGDDLEIYLPLPLGMGINPIYIIVRVIGCIHYEESRIAFETRGEFVGLQDSVREHIIKYVFEEQRRRLRKD